MKAAALAMALLLLGCGDDVPTPPPPVFAPLSYDYLTKLRLDVAAVTVTDAFVPAASAAGEHIEAVAPISPEAALRQMAQDRLVAGGGNGQAEFTITDASLLRDTGQLRGSFAVRLAVSSGSAGTGIRSGTAEARVVRTLALADAGPEAERAAAYELVRRMMDDMNVEFEFQVRRNLKQNLQADAGSPAAVQTQDLAPPPTH